MIEISEESFKEWLEVRYSSYTIKQYLSLFRGNINNLDTEHGINLILKEKAFNRSNNPLYKGFLLAYIECFKLPFTLIKSKRKNQNWKKKDYKFLTEEQVKTIIDGSSEWISLLVRLYFDTGLRLRELIETQKNNIDLDERTITGIGKGNKPFKVKFSPTTMKYLIHWLKDHQYDYCFHYDTRKIDWGKSFWYYLKKQSEELGISRVHPHRLRHALGHYLRVTGGFDLQQIKVKLRHAKIGTTEIYTTATQKEVDDKIDEEIFS